MTCRTLLIVLLGSLICAPAFARAPQTPPTLEDVLNYPYPGNLTVARTGERIAWVLNERGVRNILVADGPDFEPHRITNYKEDDGQELTQLTFSPDGKFLVYVRGGDHDANWPAAGNLAPDPDSSPTQPKVTIWSIALDGGEPAALAEGDEPAISVDNRLAYIKEQQVWTAPLDGKGKPERLFFDRGHDGSLRWSPDGRQLAFVSDRDDHTFIGIFRSADEPLEYLAASTHRDSSPRWSPDGKRVAFVRMPGDGGPPEPILKLVPQPWSIQVADVASGESHVAWRSPRTLRGSFPETQGNANLYWAAGERLVFLADLDGWPHLYSIAANGTGDPLLLTPGDFMVEYVDLSPNRRFLVYNANTGATPDDDDRRHLFRVPVDAAAPTALSSGETIEWQPVIDGNGEHVAFVRSGPRRPPEICVTSLAGRSSQCLDAGQLLDDYPTDRLVVPRAVTFKAADGLTIHGQLFRRDGSNAARPGIVFLHGGPPRQMLLGWHYMDYYSNAYAVNQYLATHGFVVLSVNYRLGIGYGHDFHHPAHWGPTGASEYMDVVAGARFLQQVDGVDAARIGLWGGSYGGYLTALGLARNADIFKAGVDLHGVHDWSWIMGAWFGDEHSRYEKGDRKEAMKVAWESSPDADVARWKSPVLLIQGDDDRNVNFHQTIDLARRLGKHDVPFDLMVMPNEIHGFLRHESWLRADTATVRFFEKQFLHPEE